MERTLGDRDPETLRAQCNLAHIRHRQHGFAEAETLYRHVLQVTREVSGNDSPDTMTNLAGLAEFLADVGKLDEAETLCREALATRRRVLPAGHIQIGESLTALAKVVAKRGQLDLAVSLLRESLAIHEAALPEGSMWTAIVEYRLGECLTYVPGNLEEAEEHLLDAHEVIERSSDQSALGGVLTALVDLYKRWHRPDDAAYYKELLDDATGR
jgi:tetratricopeptide (TPR) repeat protein